MSVAGGERAEIVMDVIRSRRAIRDYAPGPVPREHLVMVLQAGRLASSGGNNRVHRFLVLQDPRRISLIRSVAPGMLTVPTAVIVICVDLRVALQRQVQADRDTTVHIDVGTAAMNMQLMAHALGLGCCPVTSFSQAGLRAMLELPENARPELLLMLGRRHDRQPAQNMSAPQKPTLDGVAYWEIYGSDSGEPR
jgi:nitroreductase